MQSMLDLYREVLRDPLQNAVEALFDAADTALVKLASESTSNHDQNLHFDEVLSLRVQRPEICRRFVAEVLGESGQLPFTPEPGELDAQQAQSLQRMMRQQPEQWQGTPALFAGLTDLGHRHETLAWAQSPLAPIEFCQRFMSVLTHARLSMHCKMLLVRLFESRLYGRLQDFVTVLNQRLIDESVLPELKTPQPVLQQSMDRIVERELNRRAMYLASADHLFEDLLEEAQVDVFEGLDDALAEDVLLSADASMDIYNWADWLERSGQWPEHLSNEQQQQISLVRRLQSFFEALLADDDMPAIGRYLINQLQLPYLRLVLADSGFFAEQGHPAQKLLAEIVNLTHTWQVPKDVMDFHANRFYCLLSDLVRACVEAERIYNFDFHKQLAEFIALREAQRQQMQTRSQWLQDSESEAAHAQAARDAVDALLESRLSLVSLAERVDASVLEDFSNVLYKAALSEGLDSHSWRNAIALLDRLLNSLRPAVDYQSRPQFLRMVRNLLPDLRMSYETIGVEPQAMLEHFKTLEKNHKTIVIDIVLMNGAEADVDDLQLSVAQPPESADQSSSVAEVTGDTAHDMIFSIGTWLNWQRGDTVRRCQVAAYIKHADKYILTSRSGDRIGDLLGVELHRLVASGDVMVVKSGPAFESSLEHVIGDMREQRPE
ncbi:Uncharacterised protein [BD1-7 clade bacterium]|uniref:Thymidine phosphorylase n=1 Tax=BD1-7 clade bacterium TaxID=2029982 RepID=A0A5S9N626_9GAMM|nr:Uncharacterised protein [BD1-7 clade bacterium]